MNVVDLASIPEAVRDLAVEPGATARELPAGASYERIRNNRFCVLFSPLRSTGLVQRLRLAEADVPATVDEIRRLFRGRGRTQAAWFVGPSSRPSDLSMILAGLGFVPYDDPPFEPHAAAMVLMHAPLGAPIAEVTARAVESTDELATAVRIMGESNGLNERDRESLRDQIPGLYELHESGHARTYLAFVDGEPVGMGRGGFQDAGMYLAGGAVLPSARGKGAYRAMIHARWQDAVARGTPALAVQAGAMSRPILEQLGFVTVATLDVLCDRF